MKGEVSIETYVKGINFHTVMVAAPPPPNFRGYLKISDQNNWERELSKKLNLGGPKFKGGL